MRNVNITLAALACMFCMSAGAQEPTKGTTPQNQMDCSNMSPEVQQFANQLSMTNKKMFCGQFSAAQRSSAMQYATQQDANGNMMSADQAVQKVAGENNMRASQKSPTGCPIK